MSYEALKALEGHEVGVSDWFEVSQERIDAFADATLDHQWIHIDPERAAAGPFGTTIAHGFLTLSLLVHLQTQTELPVEGVRMAVNYGLDKVRFITPVPAGGRIRARRTVAEVTEASDGSVQVKSSVTVELEGAERPAAVAEPIGRYYF
ncbi:MAG: MaoC family dehydratase [Acidimicrobiia bacterium]